MFNLSRGIVEVEVLDTMGRPKRKRVLGVWKNDEDIPFRKIRRANELAYPGCEIQVKVNVYEGP